LHSVRWWDPSFADRRRESAADLEAELLHHLREAVRSRMAADVPLGAFLSGGVDSSSVVALMAEMSGSPVKTCSIGFAEAGLDESAYARQVANRFATDHYARAVSPYDFGAVGQLEQRIKSAIEFSLRTEQMANRELLPAGLEILVRGRDQDRNRVRRWFRRGNWSGDRRGRLGNDLHRLGARARHTSRCHEQGNYRHDGEVSLTGHSVR